MSDRTEISPDNGGGGFDWKLAGTIVAGIAVMGMLAGLYFFGAEVFGLA